MNKVNIKIKNLILDIEKEMKLKGIKKGDLYDIANRNTISKIFTHYQGNLYIIDRILNYIDKQ